MTNDIETIDAVISVLSECKRNVHFKEVIYGDITVAIATLKAHREKLSKSVLIPRAGVPEGLSSALIIERGFYKEFDDTFHDDIYKTATLVADAMESENDGK